jgi:hypothetical protein
MGLAQKEWRRRHKAQGLCILCSVPRFKNNRCVRHYELFMRRKREGAVAACCGELGRIEVAYYLGLKKVIASPEAPESTQARARDILKRIFNEEVA